MGVYMVNAEAMITLAAGAIAEFQIGMVGIGASANLTAAGVALVALFIVYAVDFPLEVNGGFSCCLILNAHMGEKLSAAKKEVVEEGDKRQKIQSGVGGRNHADEEVSGVNNGQPLYLDGDYKEKQHLGVGEKGGQREEHGKINEAGVNMIAYSGDEINNEAENDVAEHTREKENIKSGCSPTLLQRFSDIVVKIEKYQYKYSAGIRYKNKGDKAPNLTPQNVRSGEGEKVQKCAGGVHHGEKPNRNIARHNIEHKVFDAKAGVLIAKHCYFPAEPFHRVHLLVFKVSILLITIYPL